MCATGTRWGNGRSRAQVKCQRPLTEFSMHPQRKNSGKQNFYNETRTAGVVDQNSAVYHNAADTNPQTDVSVRWTTADEVLKLQDEARNYEPVARFHSWRTEFMNSRA